MTRHGRKFQKLDINLFYPVTLPGVSYVLGFAATDGCVHDRKDVKKGSCLKFGIQERDVELLESIKHVLGIDNNIRYYHKTKCAMLEIYHPEIVTFLKKYNITSKKSLTLEFPTKLDKKLYSHFMRGVWDGDGSVSTSDDKGYLHQDVELVSASSMFLMRCANVLMDNNIGYSFSYDNKRSQNILYRMRIRRGSFQSFYDYLYKDANIYLPRKKEKFEEILKYRDKSFEISSPKTVDALFN